MSNSLFRAAVAAAASLLSFPAMAALVVSLETPAQPPLVGQSFAVNVVVDGVGSPAGLGFFDIDVAFDPAALALDSVSVSDALGSIAGADAVNASLPPTADVANLSVLSLLTDFAFQPARFTLGTLFFTPVSAGTSALQFGFVGLESGAGDSLAFVAEGGAVTAVIPVPAAVWMLLSGMGLLGVAARRARRAPV